jgi:hypothetical protein
MANGSYSFWEKSMQAIFFLGLVLGTLVITALAEELAPTDTKTTPAKSIELTGNQKAELQQQLESALEAYADGLLERNLSSEDAHLSSELTRHFAEGLDREAAAVRRTAGIERERRKLIRGLGLKGERLDARFKLRSVEVSSISGRDIVEAYFSYGDRELPKPFYFVKEGGEFRLAIERPGGAGEVDRSEAAAADASCGARDADYLIANFSLSEVTVSRGEDCAGEYQTTVPETTDPGGLGDPEDAPGEAYLGCPADCGWWDGTLFPQTGSKCDWNQWGWDVIIDRIGGIQCHDEC